MCLSPLFAQCLGSGSLPRIVSPIAVVPWNPRTQAPWPPEPSDQGASLGFCGAATKTGEQDACKAPLQETVALWSAAEGDHRDSTYLLRSLERIIVSP